MKYFEQIKESSNSSDLRSSSKKNSHGAVINSINSQDRDIDMVRRKRIVNKDDSSISEIAESREVSGSNLSKSGNSRSLKSVRNSGSLRLIVDDENQNPFARVASRHQRSIDIIVGSDAIKEVNLESGSDAIKEAKDSSPKEDQKEENKEDKDAKDYGPDNNSQ